MKTSPLWKRQMTGCLLLALLTGCGSTATETLATKPADTVTAPAATPTSPTLDPFSVALTRDLLTAEASTPIPTGTPGPASYEELVGICSELFFDGESCTYEGPSLLEVESVTVLFFNDSAVDATWGIVRHNLGHTVQDMVDYIGEEPSPKFLPAWSDRITPWAPIGPGRRYTWKGVLGPGIHSVFCVGLNPSGLWFGAGLTVEG